MLTIFTTHNETFCLKFKVWQKQECLLQSYGIDFVLVKRHHDIEEGNLHAFSLILKGRQISFLTLNTYLQDLQRSEAQKTAP